jgi:hypothetical protein
MIRPAKSKNSTTRGAPIPFGALGAMAIGAFAIGALADWRSAKCELGAPKLSLWRLASLRSSAFAFRNSS